uniref:Uncharacterized protein n=1 Tax=Caulerpa verticillata TaxID=177082 RepID=A0A386B0E9_9CHLO|nr:hypothetical protein [Caulerpa verticillata]AYC65133.1 hypothetical protein [Caulerpa verticillata]
MLKTAGRIHSQCAYSPSSSHPNVVNLDTNSLGDITPFNSEDFLVSADNLKIHIEESLGQTIEWSDSVKIPVSKGKNLTYLENEIFGDQMSRIEKFKIPTKPAAAKIKDAEWKKAVSSQIENLSE